MNFLLKILEDVKLVFSTVLGWILAVVNFLLTLIYPEETTFLVVFVAVVLDLVFGIWAARKQKKFILSESLRETPKKVIMYFSCLLMLFLVEKYISPFDNIATKIMAAIIAGNELFSMAGNMLIIKPDLVFLKIFRKQLKGEIESKTGQKLDDNLQPIDEDTN